MLDQALDAFSVVLVLSEHRLGTADREVVHERRGGLIGLDERRYAVQRFC